MIGTPPPRSADRVRVKRAIAIFRTSGPKIGARRRKRSTASRPASVRYQARKPNIAAAQTARTMYQYRVTPLLTAITMRVGSGSGTPALSKKAAKIGMMKTIRNATTSTAMVMTRIGYTMAICTRCFSAWAFSRYVESRDSMESSTPPVSPTCTRLT